MSAAPTIRPLPGQSSRSLVTRVLCMTNSPQLTSAATGAGVIRHVLAAGVCVDVAGAVDRAHAERVRADRQAGERDRRALAERVAGADERARRERGRVERALEARRPARPRRT